MMMVMMTMMTMTTMMMMRRTIWQVNSIIPRCLGYRYMYRQPEGCHFDEVVDLAGPSSMEVPPNSYCGTTRMERRKNKAART